MHRFLAKPKTIEAGGLGEAVSLPRHPGRCLGEHVEANSLLIKHAKMVIVRVNIGQKISALSLVTQNNVIQTFSTITSRSLRNSKQEK